MGQNMKNTEYTLNGWELVDGEERNQLDPDTFEIPTLEERTNLKDGDYAKLIFWIALDDTGERDYHERMWVIVNESTSSGYVGTLDNQPGAVDDDHSLQYGSQVAFEPRHVIDIA
jgi:hypothetical protein